MDDDLVLVEKYMILTPAYTNDVSYQKFYSRNESQVFDTFEEAVNYLKNIVANTIKSYESPEGQAAINRILANGLQLPDKFQYIIGNCIVKTWQVMKAENASTKAMLHAYHLNKITNEFDKREDANEYESDVIEW